jgi:hypothetical protein
MQAYFPVTIVKGLLLCLATKIEEDEYRRCLLQSAYVWFGDQVGESILSRIKTPALFIQRIGLRRLPISAKQKKVRYDAVLLSNWSPSN